MKLIATASGREPQASRVEFNARNQMDGLELLRSLAAGQVALGILDPQYREVLDKLKFGNEGDRQIERADLPQMTSAQIAMFVAEFARVLRPSSHLVIWMDKFCLVTGRWRRWLDDTIDFATVDMIAWNKLRMGMGKRTRGVMEYAVILQKIPTAAALWRDRGLRDGWTEHSDSTIHPHAKPHGLTERLIRATTKRGDLVCDPCAGGYGVLDACIATGRRFIGCDLVKG